jgi:hypothetical protein|uniref:Uncharacterized protein n=1 Tax=viral metagenome TaxID=1070528 RepID=A0A6C0DYS0_9ZZZZ
MAHNNENNIKISLIKRNEIETELKQKQLNDVPPSKKLRLYDINRVASNLTSSIFDAEKCSLWTGYITNIKNKKKGIYINFYFKNQKKVALHRLLYSNYKGALLDSDYIKYSCDNKGICCNLNHMVKFSCIDEEMNNEEYEKKQRENEEKEKCKVKNNVLMIDDDFTIRID